MPAPVIDFLENDSDPFGGGTPINSGNPIAFGLVARGAASPPSSDAQNPIHVWNDQTGAVGSDTATNILLTIAAADSNNSTPLLDGTALNGFTSMIEARSTDALGAPADGQNDWTVISPTEPLALGDMPSNSRRSVELRLNVPIDAAFAASKAFVLSVSFA